MRLFLQMRNCVSHISDGTRGSSEETEVFWDERFEFRLGILLSPECAGVLDKAIEMSDATLEMCCSSHDVANGELTRISCVKLQNFRSPKLIVANCCIE
jgi:hypothetical protein